MAYANHRLAAGDYETRVPERSNDDEIGRLSHDFNQLAMTLQRNEGMRREFMADVSHEIRTPLGVLHGELEALEDGVPTWCVAKHEPGRHADVTLAVQASFRLKLS